jgi:N-acetylglutamate synthase-like GNAT family acetyltransferase
VKLTVASDATATSLVGALLPAFASASGIGADDEGRLQTIVEGLVVFTLGNAYVDEDLGELELTLELGEGFVDVAVHDWGLPLTSAGGDLGPLPEPLAALAGDDVSVQLLNLGSDGKRLLARVPVSAVGDEDARRHHIDAAPRRGRAKAEAPDSIEVRAAGPEDAEAIAQLLYENYHLSYVHADFYRPRYLMAELASGGLLSTVAFHGGRVIGHHALMPLAGAPSAETGAAVVHSAYRGLGIFGRMFEHTVETARMRGLESVFGDAVTIHPYSQRAEHAQGYRETALQLGMVPAQTTMRGFGGEGPNLRTATLRSYRPLDEQPRHAVLPAPYSELVESVYANLGLSLELPAEPDPGGDEAITATIDEPRALGFLRLRRWDDDAGGALRRAVRHQLSRHVDVVYVDVDLAAIGDVDQATAELNELGFFAAGLVLHGAEGHDHLRLQLLDSEEIELEELVCDSAFAQELRTSVLADMARVVA